MSRDLRTYLRAKAVLLSLVLDPPMHFSTDHYLRTKFNTIEAAFMDYVNACGELGL